jgi:uncharacterized protein (DUF2235 family)
MLYAFDGTWNMDKPGSEHDTNVLKFKEAYQGPAHYATGVGTRFSHLGEAVGGLTGAGGRTRVDEAYESLRLTLPGDPVIDIVGFSRGAALALHFANKVAIHPGSPKIRFLGLWDCVPSFGVASVDLNIGWDLDLPDNVEKCYHALALDERRNTFHLHRLDAAVDDVAQEGRLFEIWFRGVHSDVGGGNANPGLSSIPLNWMLKKAAMRGLPIDSRAMAANLAHMHPGRAISPGPWYDLVKDRRRAVRWNDQVHASVTFAPDCHNPPAGAVLVDDLGIETGRFERAAARV